jgi:beta-N-acetylhexosaminidase
MIKPKHLLIFILLSVLLAAQAFSQIKPPYLADKAAQAWADSLLNTLSLEEKVGQLFMIAAYSNKDEAHAATIERYVKQYKLGGLIFMQGTPEAQVKLNNRFQAAATIPLMIGFDGEWGLSMRLQNTITYPRQLQLGAIRNELLIYEMGREFARQMKRLGIHVNFAPVIDVNNNPENPVINDRSFGDDVQNVIKKGIMYMRGLQDGGLLACAKHFPGHGDTNVDSHYDLPVIKHSRERLNAIEMKPFRALAQNGVGSMMVAHLSIPALDNTPNLPSTLSPKVVDDILRKEMKYEGLLFTDAMNMKGVAKYFPSGQAEVKAILAGNDIMLFSEKVPEAIQGVMKAVDEGVITAEMIDQRVRKILAAKYWLGIANYQPIPEAGIQSDLHTPYAQYLNDKLHAAAITVISNDYQRIPVGDLSDRKMASINIGSFKANAFTKMINKYGAADHFFIAKDASPAEFDQMLEQLSGYDLVLCSVMDMSRFASKKFGLSDQSVRFIKKLDAGGKAVSVIFGSPYSLSRFDLLRHAIVAYSEDEAAQSAAVQVIFGALDATAELPVTAGAYFTGNGYCTNGQIRLSYGSPLNVGVQPDKLKKIDQLANEAIKMGAMPGCQILVAYKGQVIYEKAFGKHTKSGHQVVQLDDLYDIASITKVAATAPILMHLYEQGFLKLDGQLKDYLKFEQGSNKGVLGLREILAHQAGLQAWIPFYKSTLDANGKPDSNIYSKTRDSIFNTPVTAGLFMRGTYIDSMYQVIDQSDLQSKTYKYSDLGYYYFLKIIESYFGQRLDVVADSLLWKKLGGNNTMYNPLQRGLSLSRIPPTEEDRSFRMQTIQGTVHDQGVAMLGGVGAHAGLFSNANDLAKYLQMLLNKGSYGGTKFFEPGTVDAFTNRVFKNNRRALAFDKPALSGEGPSCSCVSDRSFGHSGFTGTLAWADPDHDIIFIFLSNRTYPDAENKLLINQSIRPRIQEVVYDAILGQ